MQHHIGASLRQYLLLVRLPNAFTAPPNVLAGYFAATPPAEASGLHLVTLMVSSGLLYVAGIRINPKFWGDTSALHAVLRDAAQFGVIAVGMSFVLINKDLDLSVGSTYGLVAVVFARLFARGGLDLDIVSTVGLCLLLGAGIGLANGVLVTVLRVPAFIATLTMLFIGS